MLAIAFVSCTCFHITLPAFAGIKKGICYLIGIGVYNKPLTKVIL